MERPERASYTTLDFIDWQERTSLSLSPKFQRRDVWTTPAKSYFIDTLITGRPVPPIYLRTTQSQDKKRTIREVVDGQQRIRAVLDYVSNKYPLSRSLGADYAGRYFSKLTPEQQDKIRTFSFICETLHGISDADVLEIFARLNTYSVKLNAQELRNGKYFGRFKQSAYRLALEHLEFWRNNRVFSERNIARMDEVELTSELLVAEIDGIQDKKKSVNHFYSLYDEIFNNQASLETRYRRTIDQIVNVLSDTLKDSEFRRPPLFYTLFCSIYHRTYGLLHENIQTPKRPLNAAEEFSLREAVLTLSEIILAAADGKPVRQADAPFVRASARQTDNIQPRRLRLETLYRRAFGS